jgi:hypothetical protein
MTVAARALAWELTRRHRLGFAGIALYVVAIVAIRLLFFDLGETVPMEEGEKFAILVVVPITIVFVFLLAVFTYGLAGNIGARQSIFPARLFTLPVSSGELALWPMLYAAVSVAALWLITRAFLVWPTGVPVPVFWPALAIAALFAWTQALAWMPYPLPGLRVVAMLLVLTGLQAMTLIALEYDASEWTMAAILLPQVPLAYLVARLAVSRARRGEVPDWSLVAGARRRATIAPFASAARAQAWLEWKAHGMALPFLVACLLPFELLLLWTTGETRLVWYVLLGVMITPPFLAAFAAVSIAQPVSRADMHGLSPFLATRPLSSAALIAAKLTMSVLSTAVAWLLVFVAVPIALVLSGTSGVVVNFARERAAEFGTLRATTLLLLVVGLFLLATWRALVQTLYVGLAGRVWLKRIWLSATLLALCLFGPAVELLLSSARLQIWLWNSFGWLLAAAVLLKVAGALRIAAMLHDSRLVSGRALLGWSAAWSGSVLALYALMAWWMDTRLFAVHLFGALAILIVPFTRVAAAPLALWRNRHR